MHRSPFDPNLAVTLAAAVAVVWLLAHHDPRAVALVILALRRL